MSGFDEIGHDAIGEIDEGTDVPVTYQPVSRLTAGGIFAPPAALPEIGIDLAWDNEDWIVWDDDELIGWEA